MLLLFMLKQHDFAFAGSSLNLTVMKISGMLIYTKRQPRLPFLILV